MVFDSKSIGSLDEDVYVQGAFLELLEIKALLCAVKLVVVKEPFDCWIIQYTVSF